MVLIIPHVNSELSALIFDRTVTLSSQVMYFFFVFYMPGNCKCRNCPSLHTLSAVTQQLHHGPRLHISHSELRMLRVRPNPSPGVGIPESCSYQVCGLLRVFFNALTAPWEALSALGKHACKSGTSFWQSSPTSSLKFLFESKDVCQ